MNKKETLREKRVRAGRLGGLTTFLRHRSENMAAMGRKGGRPRSPTLDDILRQQGSLQKQNIKKEERIIERALASDNLTELKRAFKLRYCRRSSGELKNVGEAA